VTVFGLDHAADWRQALAGPLDTLSERLTPCESVSCRVSARAVQSVSIRWGGSRTYLALQNLRI
jgi:hypothetical protein